MPDVSTNMPAWEDVENDFRAAFPGTDMQENRRLYENARRLNEVRDEYSSQASPGTSAGNLIQRYSLPLGSAVAGTANDVAYDHAKNRVLQGKASEADMRFMAHHELQQQSIAEAPPLARTLATLPAIVGETALGGVALRGLGFAAPAAAEGLAAGTRAAVTSPAAWGRGAATVAASPSLYAEQWTQNNIQQRRDPLDPRGLPVPFAMGMLNNAVFSSLGNVGNSITGAGVLPIAQRAIMRTGAGVVGMEASHALAWGVAQVLPEAWGAHTEYGSLGRALRGEWGEAWQTLVGEVVSAAAFAAVHEAMQGPPQPRPSGLSPAPGEPPQTRPETPPPETPPGSTSGGEPPPRGQSEGRQSPPGGQAPPETPVSRATRWRGKSPIDMFRDGVDELGKAGFSREEAQQILRPTLHEAQNNPNLTGTFGQRYARTLDTALNEAIARGPGRPQSAERPETRPQEPTRQEATKEPQRPTEPANAEVATQRTAELAAARPAEAAPVVPPQAEAPTQAPRIGRAGEQGAPALTEQVPERPANPYAEAPLQKVKNDARIGNRLAREELAARRSEEARIAAADRSEQLAEHYRLAEENGIPADHLDTMARQIRETDPAIEFRDFKRQLLKDHPELRSLAARHARGGMDYTKVKRFDLIAKESIPPEYEHLFSGMDEIDRVNRLYDLLTQAAPSKITREDAYRQALNALYAQRERFTPAEVHDVNRQLQQTGQRPLSAADIERVQAEAQREAVAEAGRHERTAEEDFFGQAPEQGTLIQYAEGSGPYSGRGPREFVRDLKRPAAEPLYKPGEEKGDAYEPPGSEPGTFDPSEFAVEPEKPSGARIVRGMKRKGAVTVPPAVADALRDLGDKVQEKLQVVADHVAELSGRMAPRTTRGDRPTGEALTRTNAAPGYARIFAPIMIDRVMGPNATEQDYLHAGAVITERALRYTRHAYNKRSADKEAEYQRLMTEAARATYPGEAERLRREAAQARAESVEANQAAHAVQSIIGKLDSPFKTIADYKAALQSPQMQRILGLTPGSTWAKEMVPVMDEAFRRSQGLEATDPIDSFTQIPGHPVNLKAIQEGDENKVGMVYTRQGNLRNPRLKKNKFSNQRTGAASLGYYIDIRDIISNSLEHQLTNAARAEWARTGVANKRYVWGTGKPIDGMREVPEVRPPKKTQANMAGETSLYVPKEQYTEVRRMLQVDEPASAIPGADLITKASLASTVEFDYHAANLLTTAFKPGVSFINIAKFSYGRFNNDPKLQDRLLELARIGAQKEYGAETGSLWGGKLDPTTWTSKALHFVNDVVRLALDDAYSRIAKAGLTVPTETGRRDFVNQAGQYNKAAQPRLIQWLRETKIGPFATAATNFLYGGVRAMIGSSGIKGSSWGAAVRLRVTALARVYAILAAVAIYNFLRWGRWDGDDTAKIGEIKIGEQDGKGQYLNVFSLTGVPRGMRATGVMDILEGVRSGKTAGAISSNATGNIVSSQLHMAEGPLVSAAHIAATGRNILGRPLASSDSHAPFFAATLANTNPTAATLMGLDRPKQEVPMTERFWGLLGPYGVKTRDQKDFFYQNYMDEQSHKRGLVKPKPSAEPFNF